MLVLRGGGVFCALFCVSVCSLLHLGGGCWCLVVCYVFCVLCFVICVCLLSFALGCGGGGFVQFGWTALQWAILNGQLGTVELLLKHKADVATKDKVTACS